MCDILLKEAVIMFLFCQLVIKFLQEGQVDICVDCGVEKDRTDNPFLIDLLVVQELLEQ